MDRKGTWTLILLAVLIAVIVFVAVPKGPKKIVSTPEEVARFTWGEHMDDVYKVLKRAYEDEEIRDRGEMTVFAEEDLDRDGVSEILVDFAASGAAASSIALVSLNDGHIEAPKMELASGDVVHARFVQGGTGLSASQAGIQDSAVYQGNVLYDPETLTLSICEVQAYSWSEIRGVYAYNMPKSTSLEKSFCTGVSTSLAE